MTLYFTSIYDDNLVRALETLEVCAWHWNSIG